MTNERTLNFSIQSIEQVENVDYANYSNDEFAIARVEFLSTRENSHELVIRENILREFAKTALRKWIVGDYSKYVGDVTDHSSNQIIFGNIPPEQDVFFFEKKGDLVARVDAVISKIYCSELYNIFEKDNFRDVSVEMKVASHIEGQQEIVDEFNIVGITVLGKRINGSCPDASMSVVRFSEEKANEFYNGVHEASTLKEFAERRKKEMADKKTYKVNKTKLKETPWGDVDKTGMRNKIMEASNKDSLVKDVYALVEDGWQDAPSEKLKYPIMELSGDTFYYNRHGLSSALGYAKKENESEVVNKVEKLYEKFKLDRNEGNETMEVKKFSQLEGREIYEDVIERVHKKLGNHYYVEEIYSDHVEIRDMRTKEMLEIPAKIKIGKDDEDPSIDIDYDNMKKSGEQKQFSKKDDKKKSDKKMEDDDDDEVEEIEEDEDEKDKKEEKKMSSDANVDSLAYSKMLEQEAMRNEKLVKELKEKDDIIMGYESELQEFKKFKEEKELEEKEFEINKTMADVKELVSEEEFKDLKEEGMECKLSEISGWSNKVKSVAFERVKNTGTKTSTVWTMSNCEDNMTVKQDKLWG